MNHQFTALNTDKSKCEQCGYDALAHSAFAKCSSCNKIGTVNACNNMLMCDSCATALLIDKRIATDVVIDAVNAHDKMLEARAVLHNITYNGDVFNAPTVPLIEIKRAIDADDNIKDKEAYWNSYCLEFYKHLCDRAFILDEEKMAVERQKMEVKENLRDIGGRIRKEIQESISSLDNNYQPLKKPVSVKIPKKNLSPFDRMAQTLAQTNNISMDEAREMMIKGGLAHIPVKK